MGKRSKAPSYSSGSVNINGRNVANVEKKDGTIYSSYNMSPTEKSIYNSVQNNLNSSLKNLYNISDSTKKQWQAQLKAYKQKGIDEINSIYDPMQTALKNDIAGRFGSLDNSVFLDKLSDITNNKAKAVSSLSDALVMKQNDLYTSEITNRMNYISLLNGINTGYNNQIMNYMNMAKSNADSGNNHNMGVYRQQSSGSGSFLNSLGSAVNMASSFMF